mgnify:CR=1 FL=1|tara:strand:+ start:775 stop:1089 length:315 start_codon:yes stop_codon:yes gene_type:complete
MKNKNLYLDLDDHAISSVPAILGDPVPCLGAECVPAPGGSHIVVWGQASRAAILATVGSLGLRAEYVGDECHIYEDGDGSYMTSGEAHTIAWSLNGRPIVQVVK